MKTTALSRLLRLARVALFGYAFILIAISLAGMAMFPAYARLHPAEFTPNNSWTPAQTQAGLAQLGWPATSMAYVDLARNLLLLIAGGGVALLLLWRQPASWFILYLAFVFISFSAGDAFFKPIVVVFPGLLAFGDFLGAAAWQFFFIVFYFFPNGQPVPVWTRWLALIWLGLLGIQQLIPDYFVQHPIWDGFYVLVVLSALGSQIYRYCWRSGSIQRQQMKWIVFVVGMLIIYLPVGILFGYNAPSGSDLRFSLLSSFANLLFFNFLFALFPLAVALAIFRYHLWDIDLVIRRTLQYGLLTLLLGLTYFGMVVLLGQAFRAFTGQESQLVVVLSTLVIAALFTPLRRSIQTGIDRRFFRQKYNAEQAIERFTAAARAETDVGSLTTELLALVEETMQPRRVSLWRKASADARRMK